MIDVPSWTALAWAAHSMVGSVPGESRRRDLKTSVRLWSRMTQSRDVPSQSFNTQIISNYSWGFRRSGTMKKFEQGATANLIELATSAASREPRIRIDIELTGILIINFTSFESIWCLQWIPTSSWRLQDVELVLDPCKFSEDAQCRRHSAHGHERNYLAIWCSLI